ncbi:MAG: hypothetical protein HQK54_09870, partial [Oligoflexales bacterium]|nr:hypothetical protein [Oligoflexales bacterium]
RFEDDAELEKLAYEICIVDQQACSSPQVLFLDTDSKECVAEVAGRLSHAMEKISCGYKAMNPGPHECAQITTVREVASAEEVFGTGKVFSAGDHSWCVIAEYDQALKASPLFRTIFVKPLPRRNIIGCLRKWRSYLQSVGLACDSVEYSDLARRFMLAGVNRITRLKGMLESYHGEPHDGVYALQRYVQRISLNPGPDFSGISKMALEFPRKDLLMLEGKPVLTKEGFQQLEVDDRDAHLFFKSGGSSGEAKLSRFTYEDYHRQMKVAAEGLYAAGLDPARDRVANLLYAGNLYGGFVSFFTILEYLRAVHFPMAAYHDMGNVLSCIVKGRVNTIIGVPSFIIRLFEEFHDELASYRGVKKIFFGGEHFNDQQKKWLVEEFGIESIRSATYGSVDAGPLGYQCVHCSGSVHHLASELQYLEILDVNDDKPVQGNEVGRLIFTSLSRKGQRLERYEIGDLGRWINGDCLCGRSEPRFELLGRFGDVFRIGGTYYNYDNFERILTSEFGYQGEMQIRLEKSGLKDEMKVAVTERIARSPLEVRDRILEKYHDLHETVCIDRIIGFCVEIVPTEKLIMTASSGKLRRVVDLRRK